MSTTTISVGGDYDVVVGTGLLDELPRLIGHPEARLVFGLEPNGLAAEASPVEK